MAEAIRDETGVESGATRVRLATVNDLDSVVELRVALLREYADHPVYGRLRPDVERRARVIGIVRCADVEGSPLLLPDRYGYVTSVYVRPEHRRHGVLHALMTVAEDWARRRGLTELRLHNSTVSAMAQSAWDQLGFEVNEEVRLKFIGR
jgi:GNAT superfamily N-acetyltransferase